MKARLLVLLIPCALILMIAGAVAVLAQPPIGDLPAQNLDSPSLVPIFTDDTLDICISQEPDSLYLYGSSMLASRQILDAIYDGPIDQVNYVKQPVILQRMPTVENGGAIVDAITVTEGSTVVNAGGSVVTLTVGASILPSGCRASNCAITYTGGPIAMDQMRVTYDLLPGLTWSDGHPLTAQDSVYSFNLNRHPDTPAAQWSEQHTFTDLYTATTATQAVWTGRPGYLPLTRLADYFWNPLPEHIWGSYTPQQLRTADVSKKKPLGWGSYVIDEWVAGSHITLHKNPHYFRSADGLPGFEHLIFHFTGNLVNRALSGTCDLVPGWFSSSAIPSLRAGNDMGLLRLTIAPGSGWEHVDYGIRSSGTYTGFAGQTQAFQDVRVRQAVAYCLDRGSIARVATGTDWVPTTYIQPGSPYEPPDAAAYPYDPTQGRALLDAAGWVDTNTDGIREKGGAAFSLILFTMDRADRRTTASTIAAQLRTNCGIAVTPIPMPSGSFFGASGPLGTRSFDLAMYAWILRGPDSCSQFETNGGQNYSGYSNPAFDAACRSLRAASSEADRITFGRAVAKIFSQDLPALPLYWSPTAATWAPHISGFVLDPIFSRLWNIEQIRVGISAQVSAEGGSVAPPGEMITYTFASGTFTAPVTVTHTALAPHNAPAPGSLMQTGRFFAVTATNANGQTVQPTQRYSIVVGYTDAQCGRIIESTLALYAWDGNAWVKEPTSQVDAPARTVTAAPNHMSVWAILGETKLTFLPVILR